MDLLIKAITLGFKGHKTTEIKKYLLLCEIQKWLRDVHKIWVQVVFDPYNHYYYCEIILWNKAPIIVTTTHVESNGEHIIVEFDSWETALEEGLQQALPLI